MLRTNKISRRSALKSLFIVSALPTVFISSCAKSITSPETSQEGNSSSLSKSHFNLDIENLESMRVLTNSNGVFEIPKKYVHSGKNKNGGKYVLTREGETDYALVFNKLEIVGEGNKKKVVKAKGLNDGTVIIANPKKILKSLQRNNNEELKRKFHLGQKSSKGGNK